jgi:8-oxo-dGTP pyrophosphatase MutT (NUDIX family)
MDRGTANHLNKKLRKFLSQRKRDIITDEQLTHSAVLIPLFIKDSEYHIVFIKRSQQVRDHKGEISFPGGLCEEDDDGHEKTALREAFEEIGILSHDVAVLGILDDIRTVSTRYRVTPVVGSIPYPYSFIINTREVDETMEIPLSQLLCEGNGNKESITRDGVTYTGSVYRYKQYVIWGATARILKDFFTIWLDLKN